MKRPTLVALFGDEKRNAQFQCALLELWHIVEIAPWNCAIPNLGCIKGLLVFYLHKAPDLSSLRIVLRALRMADHPPHGGGRT
jgi:hypothetical protein